MEDCPKCKLYRQHISLLEDEKKRLNADYEFISNTCHKLLEELSHFITDENGTILPGRGEVAAQVIKAVRYGVIVGEGLKQRNKSPAVQPVNA